MLNEKSVDEKTFKECCDLMLAGRMHPEVCAYLTGLSRPTFYKRVKQFYDPERYGELPEDFFNGRKESGHDNTGWIKNSMAVQRYLAKEEEKKRLKRRKKIERNRELKRDRCVPAERLPKLED